MDPRDSRVLVKLALGPKNRRNIFLQDRGNVLKYKVIRWNKIINLFEIK